MQSPLVSNRDNESATVFSLPGTCLADNGDALHLQISIQVELTWRNLSFNQCEANSYGGAVQVQLTAGGKLTISGLCSFTKCKISFAQGGQGGVCGPVPNPNIEVDNVLHYHYDIGHYAGFL
ncbi:MAG: hypothetical protein EZS28_031484 [Streblomastix strix]|uniref:Uncharacterized protein n=1 Tax=Streblomastix strix TaxID=222440 RepID=A0A5J4USS8_9EUKA|nr:MAG: hypothetical protein EZS28_031484 [Streblomastix strix]